MPGALTRGEGERPGAVCLMLGGCSGLIWSLGRPARRGAAVEVCTEHRVQKSLSHLSVLPGCCLPHHLQLFLDFPGGAEGGEKRGRSVSHVQTDRAKERKRKKVLTIQVNNYD